MYIYNIFPHPPTTLGGNHNFWLQYCWIGAVAVSVDHCELVLLLLACGGLFLSAFNHFKKLTSNSMKIEKRHAET